MKIDKPKLHPLAGARLSVFLKNLFVGGFERESRIQRFTGLVCQLFRMPFTLYDVLAYRSQLRKMDGVPAPVFIVGYWRSGTTHLHNILTQSTQFGFLRFGQSLMPLEILSPRFELSRTVMHDSIPKTRHIDGMKLNLDQPQEEEFALGNLGTLSYLYSYYFPRDIETHTKRALFSEGVSSDELEEFRNNYQLLVNKLSILEKGRQLVLKNPSSTMRMKMLKSLFPDAKFVHIVRNPWEVFASNVKKFPKLNRFFAWQSAGDFDYEQYVMELYPKFMRRFLEDRESMDLAPEDFVEVRFDDLVADPLAVTDTIFDQLLLPRNEEGRANIASYCESLSSYSQNNHSIRSGIIPRIRIEWKFVFEKWGFDPEPPKNIEIVDSSENPSPLETESVL